MPKAPEVLHAEVAAGIAANALLESAAYTAAMKAAAERIVAEWSKCEDPAKREILWAEQRGLLRLAKGLNKAKSDGRLAKDALRVGEVPEA